MDQLVGLISLAMVMTTKLCWASDVMINAYCCLDVQTWKGKGIFDNMQKTFNYLEKGNQGLAWCALKRFASQNEFDPDEGWRNRDREGWWLWGLTSLDSPVIFTQTDCLRQAWKPEEFSRVFLQKKSTFPYNNSWDKCAESTSGDGGGPWWLTSGWSAWDAATLRVRRSLL